MNELKFKVYKDTLQANKNIAIYSDVFNRLYTQYVKRMPGYDNTKTAYTDFNLYARRDPGKAHIGKLEDYPEEVRKIIIVIIKKYA